MRVDCLGDRHGPGHGEQDVAVIIDADGDPDEWAGPFAPHLVFLPDRAEPAAFARKVASQDADPREAGVDGRLPVTLTDVDRPGGDPVRPPVGGTPAPAARTPA
ncbi:hypothetical protein [Streptomyces sp. NPDC089795]|uniref:hypothetical protein n=1 Tax=Streptomyces sp. NPDC089795 TaxID=3155297 RepID=UPI003430A0C9